MKVRVKGASLAADARFGLESYSAIAAFPPQVICTTPAAPFIIGARVHHVASVSVEDIVGG